MEDIVLKRRRIKKCPGRYDWKRQSLFCEASLRITENFEAERAEGKKFMTEENERVSTIESQFLQACDLDPKEIEVKRR